MKMKGTAVTEINALGIVIKKLFVYQCTFTTFEILFLRFILKETYMKKLISLLVLFFLLTNLSAQNISYNSLMKKAKKAYVKKDYKNAESYYFSALEIYPSSETYEQLSRISFNLGDTCEFCSRAYDAIGFGNKEIIENYAKICKDTIKFADSLDCHFFCEKSRDCQRNYYQHFYIKNRDTVITSFYIIDTNYNVIMKSFDKFPSLNTSLNNFVFLKTDTYPKFASEDNGWGFIKNKLIYPSSAKERGVQGTVFITFIIDEDGNIQNIKLLHGVDKALDDEALRVVKFMPKWIPGRYNSHPVKVQYNLPIRFVLN